MSDRYPRHEFAMDILRRADVARLKGSELVAVLLGLVATIYCRTADGDPVRYEGLVDAAAATLWSFPGAPPAPVDPGRILSDDDLEAAEALIRAAIRWTDTPKAKVVPAFDLILAELRRLRAPRT